MRILLIDTSTERGVIAYGNCKEILFAHHLPFGSNQSKFLMPYLMNSLQPFGSPPPLEVIGVGIGPGSYTGIRLGVAVAQALAYSWRIPLVGVSSLEGFVPQDSIDRYASILDARIGGVYFQTGRCERGEVMDRGPPQVSSLDDLGKHLEGIDHLVTPVMVNLQAKLRLHYPDREWAWVERAPCVRTLLQRVEQNYTSKNVTIPPQELKLLYLRQIEAEREKEKEKKS